MQGAIEQWESEGGACPSVERLTGTAENIRSQANLAEALWLTGPARPDTECILGILECLRAGVMTREEAASFIFGLQALRNQVRKMSGREFTQRAH